MKEGALRVEASPGRVLRVIVTAELRQHLRDPLTLVFMVLVPLVLYPALGGVGHLVVSRAQASADARVLDVAIEPAIDLPANLRAVSADPEASVRDGSADIGVRRIGDQVDLWWDSRSPDSIDARGRVVEALTAARKASAERQVRAEDTDPPERRTRESAARFLPSSNTSPLVARSSVPMICSNVLLPDPEGPTMASVSPRPSSSVIPASTLTPSAPPDAV